MNPIQIGRHFLGAGHPCYVIAEAGSNHNGNWQQALALIDVAAEAGCDAVKFQIFRADHLYPPAAGQSDYLGDPRSIDEIIRSMELPHDWIAPLHAYARAKGLDFLCSAFHEQAVDWIAPYVDAFKGASYEMTHTPLLQHMVRLGKPVLQSTGAADLDEVGQAVAAVRAVCPTGELPLVLLQCTAAYPAPVSTAHVRAMVTLREVFGLWTGLSDHTAEPATAAAAAVALGAVCIEKHYTLSKRLPGPDHKFALEPNQLAHMVRCIRQTEAALGSGSKMHDPVEAELRHFARRSVFTTAAVAQGEPFTTANTAVLRRGKLAVGLDPVHYPKVIGRSALIALPAHAPLLAEQVANAMDLQLPAVQLRRATPADAHAVWRWNNHPSVRAVSLSTAEIAWPDHQTWFATKVADPQCRMWIITLDGAPSGIVRIDRRGCSGTVSIAIDPAARGQGVGPAALRQACSRYFGETGDNLIEAGILADNIASLKAFAAVGFVQTSTSAVGNGLVTAHHLRAPPR
ncbi:MAG: GNAT family N-acetyltransferase [Myxococcales bacterium]|nr:GNAT family N-acetyltransferase [Myxococcales bacterium]